MTLLLQTPAELCALCCDTLTVSDKVNDGTNFVKVTTQCCLEPICVKCVELACLVELACPFELGDSAELTTSYFTCGNCSVQTTLRRNNFRNLRK